MNTKTARTSIGDCFISRVIAASEAKKSILCVGIDIDPRDLPPAFVRAVYSPSPSTNGIAETAHLLLAAALLVIKAVRDSAVAVKLNAAFYLRYGSHGAEVLEQIIRSARNAGLLVILDAKVGDGKTSAATYANAYLGTAPVVTPEGFSFEPAPLQGDALTLETTIADPGVLEYVRVMRETGAGGFVVVHTSFGDPASSVENLRTHGVDPYTWESEPGPPVWEELARLTREWGEQCLTADGEFSLLGGVVGATRGSEDGRRARHILGHNRLILGPGYGAQGGTAADAVSVAADGPHPLVLVSSSRGITKPWGKGSPPEDTDTFAETMSVASEAARVELNTALEHEYAERARKRLSEAQAAELVADIFRHK